MPKQPDIHGDGATERTLEQRIMRLLKVRRTFCDASSRMFESIDDDTPLWKSKEEAQEYVEYMKSSIEVKRAVLESPFIASTNPEVRRYVDEILQEVEEEDWDCDDDLWEPLVEEVIMNRFCVPWFCREYVRLAKVFTKYELPDDLKQLLDEARRCYCFEQYMAAVALSRVAFEKCFTDLAERKGIAGNRSDRYGDYPPKNRLDSLVGSKGIDRNNMRRLYNDLSDFIHAHRKADHRVARELLERTMRYIELLVNKYG